MNIEGNFGEKNLEFWRYLAKRNALSVHLGFEPNKDKTVWIEIDTKYPLRLSLNRTDKHVSIFVRGGHYKDDAETFEFLKFFETGLTKRLHVPIDPTTGQDFFRSNADFATSDATVWPEAADWFLEKMCLYLNALYSEAPMDTK